MGREEEGGEESHALLFHHLGMSLFSACAIIHPASVCTLHNHGQVH